MKLISIVTIAGLILLYFVDAAFKIQIMIQLAGGPGIAPGRRALPDVAPGRHPGGCGGRMSGAVSLEGDAPVTIVGPSMGAPPAAEPPVTPEPPPEAPPPEAEEQDPPDAVVDAAGRKLVPLEALRATRQELKAAKALAGQVDGLQAAAARGEQLGQFFSRSARCWTS